MIARTGTVEHTGGIFWESSRKNVEVVGIADAKVTTQADRILVTHSLGSCLGITLQDPVAGVGAMIHLMLPEAKIVLESRRGNPWMFVDTGVQKLIDQVLAKGARINRLKVRVAGAANVLDHRGFFRVGERNYAVLRRVLWKNGLLIAGEDVGGSTPRTLILEMETGATFVHKEGKLFEI
jgi:chemotaxis protein CheD